METCAGMSDMPLQDNYVTYRYSRTFQSAHSMLTFEDLTRLHARDSREGGDELDAIHQPVLYYDDHIRVRIQPPSQILA